MSGYTTSSPMNLADWRALNGLTNYGNTGDYKRYLKGFDKTATFGSAGNGLYSSNVGSYGFTGGAIKDTGSYNPGFEDFIKDPNTVGTVVTSDGTGIIKADNWQSKVPSQMTAGELIEFNKTLNPQRKTYGGLTGGEWAQTGLGLAGLAATVDAQRSNERMAEKTYGLEKDRLDLTKAELGWDENDKSTIKTRTASKMASAFA